MPTGIFIMLLVGYVIGSFVGGLTATILSGRDNFVPATIVRWYFNCGWHYGCDADTSPFVVYSYLVCFCIFLSLFWVMLSEERR